MQGGLIGHIVGTQHIFIFSYLTLFMPHMATHLPLSPNSLAIGKLSAVKAALHALMLGKVNLRNAKTTALPLVSHRWRSFEMKKKALNTMRQGRHRETIEEPVDRVCWEELLL